METGLSRGFKPEGGECVLLHPPLPPPPPPLVLRPAAVAEGGKGWDDLVGAAEELLRRVGEMVGLPVPSQGEEEEEEDSPPPPLAADKDLLLAAILPWGLSG